MAAFVDVARVLPVASKTPLGLRAGRGNHHDNLVASARIDEAGMSVLRPHSGRSGKFCLHLKADVADDLAEVRGRAI